MNYEEIESLLNQAKAVNDKGNIELAERLANEVLVELEKLSGSIENKEAKNHSSQDEGGPQSEEFVRLQCEANISLAITNTKQGKFDKALEQANRALALANDSNLDEIKPRAWTAIGSVHISLGSYDKALEYYNVALAMHQELGDKSGAAAVTGNIGNVYNRLGSYVKALEYLNLALTAHQDLGDKSRVASVTGNIGTVYISLGNFDKTLEYFNTALASHQELGDKYNVALVTGNTGNVYFSLGNFDKALEYLNSALAYYQELGDKSGEAIVTGNIGNAYGSIGSYDKALEYLNIALTALQELGIKSAVALVTGNIGTTYAVKKFDGYDPRKAEEFLLKAVAINAEIGAKSTLANQYKALSDLYENEKRWEEAFVYHKKYIEVKDEINIEETKKQDSIREQLKAIELAKAAAAARMNATTSLLHRVLPESISTRMINGEENISDYFPSVSILFADIQGFTAISANMKAIDVVRFLNFVFGEFDRIMKVHGCEKIKTIGDGYMAVAGAPIECEDHAERLAAAALEMQENIHLPEDIRSTMPPESRFGIRIGLHTGSVVAGVIGEERFVYDIHSDAVNLASRMESSGEVDRVHVSSDFAEHLQARFKLTKNAKHGILFEDRGESNIKGKGMMKTYFLEKKS